MEMNFDVAKQKKMLLESKKTKKKTEEKVKIPRTTDAYPVVGMTDDHMVITNEGAPEYSYYIRVLPRDLTDLSDEEYLSLKRLCWNFHKSYGYSLKEIYLPFKEENQKQQAYVQYKLNQATESYAVRELQLEMSKLRNLEQFYTSFRSFVVIYATSPEKLNEQLDQFLQASKLLFSPAVMNRNEVRSLLTKVNNMGGNN